MKKPWIVVVSHLPARDYFGAINLVAHLKLKGYPVSLIGAHVIYERKMSYTEWVIENRPDVIVVPKLVDPHRLREAIESVTSEYKPFLIVIPTEFGMCSSRTEEYVTECIQKVGKRNADGADAAIVISEAEKKTILQWYSGIDESSLVVAGHPRYDSFSDAYRYMRKTKETLLAEWGISRSAQTKVVTLATSFPRAHFYGRQSSQQCKKYIALCLSLHLFDASVAHNIIENNYKMREAFIRLTEKLATKYTKIFFVIKVHPDESEHYYLSHFSKMSNVRVVKDCVSSDFLQVSDLHIHHYCTTALEAGVYGVPCLHYEPKDIRTVGLEKDLLRKSSFCADSYEGVDALVAQLCRNELECSEDLKRVRALVLSQEIGDVDGGAGLRCAAVIDRLVETEQFKARELPYANRDRADVVDRMNRLLNFHISECSWKQLLLADKTFVNAVRIFFKRCMYALFPCKRFAPFVHPYRYKNVDVDVQRIIAHWKELSKMESEATSNV